MPGDVQLLLYLDLSNKKPFQYSTSCWWLPIPASCCCADLLSWHHRLLLPAHTHLHLAFLFMQMLVQTQLD